MQRKNILLFSTLLLAGLILRLWNINFGLPHSWYADEPEIGEPAIKYTYEIKNIVRNNDIYKLVPQSYVYGTFPVYAYTLATMVFSKTMGTLGAGFEKMDLYVFMRVINALLSFALIPVFYLLLKNLEFTKKPLIAFSGLFLIEFNWKLIVHAHYLNHDIIITLLILLANLFFYRYLKRHHKSIKVDDDTLNTLLFALFFGLAVSTKITVLLTLPIYFAFFVVNRDFKNLLGSLLVIMGVFIVTNPFAWLFMGNFVGRLLEMRTKEAGMVFDSVNYSPFKYLQALAWMLTLPILLISSLGIGVSLRKIKYFQAKTSGTGGGDKSSKQFFVVMLLQIVFYIVFFTLQSRRVDRWMLPIIPNLMLFSLVGLNCLLGKVKKPVYILILAVVLGGTVIYYLSFPVVLTTQFQRQTPKSASYIWAKENLPPMSTKFGITEEGLDPLNKLPYATIWQFNVYESDGAQFVYPPDPLLYDYVIVSSRPMSWTKKPEVVKKHTYYASRWQDFSDLLSDTTKFKLIKSFELSEPNLIPLSNVKIYQTISGERITL